MMMTWWHCRQQMNGDGNHDDSDDHVFTGKCSLWHLDDGIVDQ